MKREILQSLVDMGPHESRVLVTRLDSGVQWLVSLDQEGRVQTLPDDLPTALAPAIDAAVRSDRPSIEEPGGTGYFLRPFAPPVRVVLVGAVHVAQALAPMAGLAGLGTTVIDPRSAWLTDFRMPGVERVRAWPGPALAKLVPDHRTAVVTLTHDPKVDDPALIAALASPAFYVGALGSRRTHAKRLERLRERGIAASDLERIHSPVGLDIGARNPAEIAVSVLAEILSVLLQPA